MTKNGKDRRRKGRSRRRGCWRGMKEDEEDEEEKARSRAGETLV